MKYALLVCALAACRIDSLDLSGKVCPCPDEYRCDSATNTCTREAANDPDGGSDTTDAGFDLVTGLLYHYKLDETSGQVVPDSSPTGRPGWSVSATETQWITGRVGNAMHFNGVGYQSFIRFPAVDDKCGAPEAITGSFTASAWAKFDSFHTYQYTLGDVVAMHGTAGGVGGGWGIGASDGCGASAASVSIELPNDGLRVNRCGATALAIDTWYHITGVYNAATQTLDIYLNGVKDNAGFTAGSPGVPSSINSPPNQCAYIASSANQNKLLFGSVDEFRLYSRALTSAEIAELYRVSQ